MVRLFALPFVLMAFHASMRSASKQLASRRWCERAWTRKEHRRPRTG
jgi:hypothetical protein